MAKDNKPEDDAQAMREAYNEGVPINDIAAKYNHTAYEVEQVVVTPVTEEPSQPVEPPKSDKTDKKDK